MIRILEHKDWVIFSLLGIGFLYVFVLRVLLRDINLVEFFTLKKEVANNTFQAWLLVSLGFAIAVGLALSSLLPMVPHWFATEISVWGYQPNKIGSVLLSLLVLFAFRNFFTYFLFASIGDLDRWASFYFVATKFFMGSTLALIALILAQYYLSIDTEWMLYAYMAFFSISFIFKNLVYYFHKDEILPEEWYYKILYICTLQILPFLVVWKFLFL
ncbi:DUF4271 domain-containing protein [Riemerella columbina]|uniref:DUF4271 domain-containing protein n=1 Tax=Riemerella columbina TaxID=103810 RepID=UPI00266F7DD6|nr:DUF4271 domain-containing protein [Riemerella columbina]WKS95255.1 DUF4271 domain-containing protein [Riemerella columbina]